MNTKQTNKEWSWIKGSHGYGHEIMQLRDGENPPKRVCILDCQESAFLEYDTEFPIVPEANIEIGSDEHLNSANKRFDDETLQANARLIASAPEMLKMLKEIHDRDDIYYKIKSVGVRARLRKVIAKAEGGE